MRLSQLAKARVVSEHGDDLGRLVDLRAGQRRREAKHAAVRGLVCGTVGLLERFGLRAPGGTRIAWGRVVRIDGDRIVVARSGAPSKQRGARKPSAG